MSAGHQSVSLQPCLVDVEVGRQVVVGVEVDVQVVMAARAGGQRGREGDVVALRPAGAAGPGRASSGPGTRRRSG